MQLNIYKLNEAIQAFPQVHPITDEETKEELSPSAQKTVHVAPINEEHKHGNEVGDTCPICRQVTVEDLGVCNTSINCNAQLKCGL